jgi:hypothetical protein
MERQGRKVDGAMRAFGEMVKERVEAGKEYLVVSPDHPSDLYIPPILINSVQDVRQCMLTLK